MAGMINGGAVIPPPTEEETMGMPAPMGEHPPYYSNGLDQSVDVGELYQEFLTNNPHADPEAAFMAGVDIGIRQGNPHQDVVQDGGGVPVGAEEFVPPTGANEFGEDVAPIPGMGTETEWGGRTITPYDNFPTGEGFSVYGPGQMYGQGAKAIGQQGQQQKRPRGPAIPMDEFGIGT